ncbi:MAG: hypothetical protein HZC40_06090 [Chloroflexi bacterium]|nr:hypothetical protein [Chloroflexota bacterium]
MPRRATPKQQKRDWRWYVLMSINGLVVLSMVIGTVLIFAPPPPPRPNIPTIEVPTLIPTPVVTPTPKPMSFADYTFDFNN